MLRERPLNPPDDPYADEIATLLDALDETQRALWTMEDELAPGDEALEGLRERVAELEREVDYIWSGEREQDWKDEAMERMWSD